MLSQDHVGVRADRAHERHERAPAALTQPTSAARPIPRHAPRGSAPTPAAATAAARAVRLRTSRAQSATALAITPPTGMMPPSPAPLAPSGLIGDGYSSSAMRADRREVARGRQQIVGERAGQELAVLVVDEILQQRAAEPLHDRADGLAVQRQRIDDAADVLDRHVVDAARRGRSWDRPRRGRRARRSCRCACCWRRCLRRRCRRRRAPPAAPTCRPARPPCRRRASTSLGAHCQALRAAAARIASCSLSAASSTRRAAHHDRARVIGAVAVARHRWSSRGSTRLMRVHRHFERVGGDLREHRLDALPDRRRADVDRDRAVALRAPAARSRVGPAAPPSMIAADRDAVVAAVDQLALQLRLLGPADLLRGSGRASSGSRRCRSRP